VGAAAADDAAVYRLSADRVMVQTVDYFPPVVDDPYWFGAIAAANALSDIYAMGAKPALALNLISFPVNKLPLAVLEEILRGGGDKAAEAGVPVVGGHSLRDEEPKYGLAVTGFAHPQEIHTHAQARLGDLLVLTKPLGLGVITTAIKREAAPADLEKQAIEVMATLNKDAAEAARALDVSAVTDVTGFGFLGHLAHIVQSSGLGARVEGHEVPVLEGAAALASAGFVSGGTEANLESLQALVDWGEGVDETTRILLADAQTSGGLLFAVSPQDADELLSRLRSAGTPAAAIVGRLVSGPAGRIEVRP